MLNFMEEKEEKDKEENMERSLKERKTEAGCNNHKEYSTVLIFKKLKGDRMWTRISFLHVLDHSDEGQKY